MKHKRIFEGKRVRSFDLTQEEKDRIDNMLKDEYYKEVRARRYVEKEGHGVPDRYPDLKREY